MYTICSPESLDFPFDKDPVSTLINNSAIVDI